MHSFTDSVNNNLVKINGSREAISFVKCFGMEVNMSNISELDLQNLRHLMGGFDTTHCKLQEYAKEATDPQIKQFFEKGAKSAMENKQQLMKFLN